MAIIRQIVSGLFVAGFLALGFVLGMLAADWSMDILDYNPECIYENWYDYVNGDFSDALDAASWAGLIYTVVLFYPALIVGGRGKPWNIIFYCVMCVLVIMYIVWLTLVMYIMLFFSYVYFEETHLVHTCGGLPEVRNTWWISCSAVAMLIPTALSSLCYCCWR